MSENAVVSPSSAPMTRREAKARRAAGRAAAPAEPMTEELPQLSGDEFHEPVGSPSYDYEVYDDEPADRRADDYESYGRRTARHDAYDDEPYGRRAADQDFYDYDDEPYDRRRVADRETDGHESYDDEAYSHEAHDEWDNHESYDDEAPVGAPAANEQTLELLTRRAVRQQHRHAPQARAHRHTSARGGSAPATRRGAHAARSNGNSTGPIAPAVTAAVLFAGATGAAAASDEVSPIFGSMSRSHINQTSDREDATREHSTPSPSFAPTEVPNPQATWAVDTGPTHAPAAKPVARDAARPTLTPKPKPKPAPSPAAKPKPKPLPPKAAPTADAGVLHHVESAVRWIKPALDAYVSSGFGWRWGRMHEGVDLAGPQGQLLYALGSGTVTQAGWENQRGNTVYLRLDDGTVLVYAHLDRIDVVAGQRVKVGGQVGTLGNTGNSTGPHLHLEVHPGGGAAIDPVPWLQARGLL